MNELVIRSEDDKVVTSIKDQEGLCVVSQNTKNTITLSRSEVKRVVNWMSKWLDEQEEEPK